MKHLKLMLTLVAAAVLAACDGGFKPNNGYPFGLKYNNLNGPVRYYVVSDYTDGYVSSAERYDYSRNGILQKKVYYAKGDSTVTNYIYGDGDKIESISSPDVAKFKAEFSGEQLVKETFYTDAAETEGLTFTFEYNDEGLVTKRIYKELDSSDETTVTFTYNGAGTRASMRTDYPDGRYKEATCDIHGNEMSIVHYDKDGDVRRRDTVIYEYDQYGNWTKATTMRKGRTTDYRTRSYQYYEGATAKPADNDTSGSTSFNTPSYSSSSNPSNVLVFIIFALTIGFIVLTLRWANEHWSLFSEWAGTVRDDGMRRLWMYNYQPYAKVGIIMGSVIVSFIASIALLLLVGGITWLLFWIVKIILWAIIVIGWICLVGGVILIFVAFWLAVIPIIIGVLIVAFQDTLERWADTFVAWGDSFFASVNAFDWAVAMFETYGAGLFGIVILLIFGFLGIALLLMVVSLILRAIEFVVVKIYNVKRPCPFCGNSKSGEFVYIVDGKEYPKNPSPGMYGVFHQTNHLTGTRVPTMLLNGKAELTRKCKHCDRLINTEGDNAQGTPVHIGIVGNRSSGKSYMLFTALEMLQEKFGGDFTQVDADNNNKISAVAKRIHDGAGIQTQVSDRYKAIHATLKRKLGLMPYHLFFYDVAGEMFDINAARRRASAMEFYNNVGAIIFLIDPSMIDTESGSAQPSESFAAWLKDNCKDTEKYDVESTLSTLTSILEREGRKLNDINLIITCSKADLGYFQATGYGDNPQSADIERFVRDELGLANMVNYANRFKSVSYAAVSAIADDKTALVDLFMKALESQGVNKN